MIEHINYAASSPYFIGAMMLILNVGSKFITHEFSVDDTEYADNMILRRIAIFAVCFIGTRDVIISLVLTAGFILVSFLFFRVNKPERMQNPDLAMRAAAGLMGQIDAPAYDTTAPIIA